MRRPESAPTAPRTRFGEGVVHPKEETMKHRNATFLAVLALFGIALAFAPAALAAEQKVEFTVPGVV